MKKLLSMVIVLLIAFSVFPVTALAAETNTGFTYVFGSGGDDYFRVTKENAPLRASSSNSGEIITRLQKGQLVKVVDTFVTIKLAKWHKISYMDSAGKTCTGYLYSENASFFSSNVNEMCSYAMKLYEENGIYKAWGLTKSEIIDRVCTNSTKQQTEVSMLFLLKLHLDQAVDKSMDISSYNEKTYYSYYSDSGKYCKDWGLYEIYGGCTWYAFNRFRQINGTDLMFKGAGGGNANQWDDRIMLDRFKKINASGLTNGMINAVGVDDQGFPVGGVYYGHVVYIEAVLGDNVYFSEGWYSNGFHSRLRCVSINDFANTYETVIIPL